MATLSGHALILAEKKLKKEQKEEAERHMRLQQELVRGWLPACLIVCCGHAGMLSQHLIEFAAGLGMGIQLQKQNKSRQSGATTCPPSQATIASCNGKPCAACDAHRTL